LGGGRKKVLPFGEGLGGGNKHFSGNTKIVYQVGSYTW